MARKRNAKAKTPAEILAEKIVRRARDLEAVNVHPEAAALPSFDNVEVTHLEREKVDGAVRVDAFLALRDGMQPGAFDAVRRLESDIAVRHGEADRGRMTERVSGGGSLAGSTDAMVDAGWMVDTVAVSMGRRDWWLLMDLVRPKVPRLESWRQTVERITGEENPVAQGAAVRSACANLVEAYKTADQLKAERDRRKHAA